MQTATILNFTLSFSGLTKIQMDDLSEFHDVTLARGTLKFGWVHPRRYVPRSVQFSGPPQENRLAADRWSVSLGIAFVDIDPAWSGDVILSNGFMEEV